MLNFIWGKGRTGKFILTKTMVKIVKNEFSDWEHIKNSILVSPILLERPVSFSNFKKNLGKNSHFKRNISKFLDENALTYYIYSIVQKIAKSK